MNLRSAGRKRRHRRRASSYVFFVGTAMVVAIIGVSALMAVRVQWRSAEGENDLAAARFYAQAAIEYGYALTNKERNWRNSLGVGYWATNESIGDGTLSLEVRVIGSGSSTILADDSVTLVGTGRSGQATHRAQVTLIPAGSGVAFSPGSWKRVFN